MELPGTSMEKVEEFDVQYLLIDRDNVPTSFSTSTRVSLPTSLDTNPKKKHVTPSEKYHLTCRRLYLKFHNTFPNKQKRKSVLQHIRCVLFGGTNGNLKLHFHWIAYLCMANIDDLQLKYKFRETGLKRFNFFIDSLSRHDIQKLNIRLLIYCVLNLIVCFYQKTLYKSESMLISQQKLNTSKELYQHILYLTLPEKQREIMRRMINYFNCNLLWCLQEVTMFVFEELFKLSSKPRMIAKYLEKEIERTKSMTHINCSKEMSRILKIMSSNG